MESIQTKTTAYLIDEWGIFHSVVKPGVLLTLPEAKENEAARSRLIGGKRLPILLDIRNIGEMTAKAIQYTVKSGGSENYTAVALLVGSTKSAIIAAFSTRFNQSGMPLKQFSDKEKAIAWLKSYAVKED